MEVPLLRPHARRAPSTIHEDVPPESSSPSLSPRPSNDSSSTSHSQPPKHAPTPPARTKSVLNLTSSTLFGIFAPNAADTRPGALERDSSSMTISGLETPSTSVPPTPGGLTPLGSGLGLESLNMTNSKLGSIVEKRRNMISDDGESVRRRTAVSMVEFAVKSVLLFGIGVAYGVFIGQIHNTSGLQPVTDAVAGLNRRGWMYLSFWGSLSIVLGHVVPVADSVFEGDAVQDSNGGMEEKKGRKGADWTAVVRSLGAFVGIAFAIRRLPWTSTLQVSLTLALANPALWYLIDGSIPGFIISSSVAIFGSVILGYINPAWIPSPSIKTASPMVNLNSTIENILSDVVMTVQRREETIGVWVWVASVLFCGCLCFGLVGRRMSG